MRWLMLFMVFLLSSCDLQNEPRIPFDMFNNIDVHYDTVGYEYFLVLKGPTQDPNDPHRFVYTVRVLQVKTDNNYVYFIYKDSAAIDISIRLHLGYWGVYELRDS